MVPGIVVCWVEAPINGVIFYHHPQVQTPSTHLIHPSGLDITWAFSNLALVQLILSHVGFDPHSRLQKGTGGAFTTMFRYQKPVLSRETTGGTRKLSVTSYLPSCQVLFQLILYIKIQGAGSLFQIGEFASTPPLLKLPLLRVSALPPRRLFLWNFVLAGRCCVHLVSCFFLQSCAKDFH